MMCMPKVRVVIPTYNREKYLRIAIQSVLNQTFQDFELYILDNASTDNTSDVVRSFKDDRISYIRNESNIGGLANYNKALKVGLEKCEYVILFHDDDIMTPQLLEREVKVLDEHPDVILVATDVELIDGDGNTIAKRSVGVDKDIIFDKYEYVEHYIKNIPGIYAPTVMMRRSFFVENNIEFKSEVGLAIDNYLWFEINMMDCKYYLIHLPLLKYRKHGGQESHVNIVERLNSFFSFSYRLLEKNNVTYLMPRFKVYGTRFIFRILIKSLSYGQINKDEYNKKLVELKSQNYWTNNTGLKLRTLSLAYYFPGIARAFHKLKSTLRSRIAAKL